MTTKLRIRHIDPDKLTPHPENENVREMTAGEKDALRKIINRFGLVEPLVVSKASGYLIGGHRRREIAIEDDLGPVPIVELEDLTPEEEITLLVALNNAEAQGRFNTAGLVEALSPVENTSLIEAAGFTFDRWQEIQMAAGDERLKAGREGHTPPVAEKGAKTRTNPGDVWKLGVHTLVVGDATHPDAYPDGPVDMTFTDPPYNVDVEGGTEDHLTILNDAWEDAAAYSSWLRSSLEHIRNNTTGAIYLCYAITMAPAVMAAWEKAGLHQSTTIAWVKDRFVLGRSDYHWQWEAILYGWPDGRGPDRYWFGGRNEGNVWEHEAPKRGDRGRKGPSNVWRYKRPAASRLHPTMKPVAMVEHAIRNSSPPGGTVLDPFGGAGSTLIAAENIGRHAHLIEIDPRYADVIIARYESLEDTPDPEKIT